MREEKKRVECHQTFRDVLSDGQMVVVVVVVMGKENGRRVERVRERDTDDSLIWRVCWGGGLFFAACCLGDECLMGPGTASRKKRACCATGLASRGTKEKNMRGKKAHEQSILILAVITIK